MTLYMMYNLIGWRTLQMEQQAMEAIAEQRRSQYAFSQELIDTINIKSHDLKKQLRYLKANRVAGAMHAYMQSLPMPEPSAYADAPTVEPVESSVLAEQVL